MTLIELYDQRPIENILAAEVFHPERVVFLAPQPVAQNKALHGRLRAFFAHRGLETETVFLESSIYNADKLLRQLNTVTDTYPDCVLDITGGTDAALFASGKLCSTKAVPTITYSRRRNRFYSINGADFADGLECQVSYTVKDCIMMAGGALRTGRVDNGVLGKYADKYRGFFRVFMGSRTLWTTVIKYIQLTSQNESSLTVSAPLSVRSHTGGTIKAPMSCLEDLSGLGFLLNLKNENGRVQYTFADSQIRTWLRDIGSVLELYVYYSCLGTKLFNDVRISAVVNWEEDNSRDSVTNEIDVMAVRGIVPLFISCKTCPVDTDALNELAILAHRFGGEMAKAAIVTTTCCKSVTRRRAAELGIDVIDLNDIKNNEMNELIVSIMKSTGGRI